MRLDLYETPCTYGGTDRYEFWNSYLDVFFINTPFHNESYCNPNICTHIFSHLIRGVFQQIVCLWLSESCPYWWKSNRFDVITFVSSNLHLTSLKKSIMSPKRCRTWQVFSIWALSNRWVWWIGIGFQVCSFYWLSKLAKDLLMNLTWLAYDNFESCQYW